MTDAVVIHPGDDTREPSVAGVSWPAVAAGAVVSCALTVVLIAFGLGLGLSVVSPWAGAGVSATTFKIGTGLYLIVILSSSIGGYIAGRLRTRWIGVHSGEVYFRDTAHGFIAWAFASVLGAILLASPVSSMIGGGSAAAFQGAAASTGRSSGPMDGYVDALLRPDAPSSQQGDTNESRGELGRLLASSFRNGNDLKPADRGYISKVVAARTGLSQADADKRVNEVVAQAKSDIDAARKATAQLAFWLTASLLLGAFCSSLAATEGGGLRDGTSKYRTRR
jgi:hypothetical protein